MKEKGIEKPIITRMTERGQITIPEQIRKRLGFEKGEYFAASSVNDLVILKRVETPSKELNVYARKLEGGKGIKLLEEGYKEMADEDLRTAEEWIKLENEADR